MEKRISTILLLFFLTTLGCASTFTHNIIVDSYNAADMLVKNSPPDLSKDTPILVASFVDVDNLEKSTTLGRMLSEQFSSRLVQRGFHVKEIKVSKDSLFVKQRGGDFILSRNLANLKESFNANYVIVGTYSIAYEAVYISSRIVRIEDNKIVSTYDFMLLGTKDLWKLVKDEGPCL